MQTQPKDTKTKPDKTTSKQTDCGEWIGIGINPLTGKFIRYVVDKQETNKNTNESEST